MNKSVKNALLVACALALVGMLIVCAAYAFGARPGLLWNVGRWGLPYVNIGASGMSGYKAWDNAFDEDGNYRIAADGLESLSLDWIAGNVTVQVYDGDEVRLSERAAATIPEEAALRYGVENGVLYVQYCPRDATGKLPEKELTVTIPKALADNMASFSYDASSASLLVSYVRAERFSFDSSSGDLNADAVKAGAVVLNASSGDINFSGEYEKLNADTSSGKVMVESLGEAVSTSISTSSGDVHISGSVGELTVDTTSGTVSSFGALVGKSLYVDTSSGRVNLAGGFNKARVGTTSGEVSLAFAACPEKLDVETSSGGVTLALPQESGFTLRYDTSSGEMNCGFAVVMDGDKYVCGDGSADFSVDTSSGDLRVKAK